MTTPIVAALPGVGALTVEGAGVFADAGRVGSDSGTRVEQLLAWGGEMKS